MNKLITWITKKLMAWCEKRGKVFKITGTAGPDDVYLIRYYVVQSKYFNFFIHQFLRSDRDDLHDHPWHFCTYLVSGSYTERFYNPKTGIVENIPRVNKEQGKMTFRDLQYGSKVNRFVFRKATHQHQVVVDVDRKECDKESAATTLFFSGPTIREWGFIRNIGEIKDQQGNVYKSMFGDWRIWIPWREYLGLPPDTPGRG